MSHRLRPFRENLRARFARIEGYYQDHYRGLDRRGEVPYQLTALGAWAASVPHHVFEFFTRIDLARYRLFLDLGSGDGIVTCIAGLFTRAVGIEIDQGLCRTARRAIQRLDLAPNVGIICGDYRRFKITKADCLYMYPDKPFTDVAALMSGWSGVLLVSGPHFPPAKLIQADQLHIEKDRLTIYQSPDRVDGKRSSGRGSTQQGEKTTYNP